MNSKRTEATLVLLLLVLCVGGVLFVFTMMSRPGGAFEAEFERPPPGAREPAGARPRGLPAAVAPPAEAQTPPPPVVIGESSRRVEAGPVGAHTPVEPEREAEAEDPYTFAQLTLELVAPAEEPDRAVIVTVRDREGEPVPDAMVVVREGTAILFRTRTNDAGRAQFIPWPEEKGPFRIDALAYGFSPATSPAVAAGADTELILRTRPVVEGVVKAPSRGEGHVKLWVGGRELRANLAADGSFRFDDLEPGEVVLQAFVEPYGMVTDRFYLEDGTVAYRRLRVRPESKVRIFGSIRFWPRAGTVWINGVRVAVNPSGSYAFDDAVIGTNEIVIDAPGKALVRRRFDVRSLQKSKYDFKLRQEAIVRGRVRGGRNNLPVAGAQIRVGIDFGNPRNERVPLFPIDKVPVVETDAEGRFEIRRLDPRMVALVSVIAPGYGQFVGEAMPDGGLYAVRLPEGPFMYGKLRGLGGVPRDAVVTATPLEAEPDGRRFNVAAWKHSRSDRDRKGFYGLSGLVPGAYLVRVDAPGYGSIETIVDFYDGRRARVDLRMRRGEFAEDADAELLSRLPPILYGEGEEAPEDEEPTVLHVDAHRPVHEEPFPGVRVAFFEDDLEFAPPMEFNELEFDIFGLPEATYRAILTHPRLKKPVVVDEIQVRRGNPILIELR